MARPKKVKPEVEKKPVGRPRTTLEDLPEDWKEKLIDVAQSGGSAVEAKAVLGIYHSAWDTLLADSEEFRNTITRCKILCQVWWEKRGREMADGKDGNSAVWIFNMKNRFGWKDQVTVSGDPDNPFALESKQRTPTRDELIQLCKDKGLPLTMFEKVVIQDEH